MKHTEDFVSFLDAVAAMRSADLPKTVAEAAVRAALDEYKMCARDARFLGAAEHMALFPPKVEPEHEDSAGHPQEVARPSPAGGKRARRLAP